MPDQIAAVVPKKKCKKCQADIPASAKACQHCSADQRNWFMRHKIMTGILGLIVLVIALSAVNGGGNNNSLNNPSSTANSSQDNKQQKTYKVGEDAVVGDIRWKVAEVKDRGNELRSSESKFPTFTESKKTPGKYVQIKVEVENLSKDLRSVSDLNIIDDQNRSFVSSSDTSDWVPNEESLYILSNLNPNVPYKFTAIYAVAADSKGLKLKIGDLKLFGSQEALIDLGL